MARSSLRLCGLTRFPVFRVAIVGLWLVASNAHGQEATVVFNGTIVYVPTPPAGYTVDPEVQVGTPFSGSYALPVTNTSAFGTDFSKNYPIATTTGSIQIGSLSAVGAEDPVQGSQMVLINNDFPDPILGELDSWSLFPFMSDGASGGAITSGDPHFCAIFFGRNNPPDRFPEIPPDAPAYFVNDTLVGWGIFLPTPSISAGGWLHCWAGSSPYVGGNTPLFFGVIESIGPPPDVPALSRPGFALLVALVLTTALVALRRGRDRSQSRGHAAD